MEQNGLAAFKNWLQYQQHLPSFIDDTILQNFLNGCKNNAEIAKIKLDNFYSRRHDYPEFFSNRDPRNEEIKRSVSSLACITLPLHTPDGYNVNVTKILDIENFEPTPMVKRILMMFDVRIKTGTLTDGEILIHDCSGITLQNMTKFSISFVKNFIHIVQTCMPARIKAVIMINVPTYMEKLLNLSRTFMNEKLRKRFYVYSGNHVHLYDHLPKSILPGDYDGELTVTIADINESWYRKLIEHEKWFIDDNYMMSDETKRIGKRSTTIDDDDVFGYDGSFKKIAID